MGNMFTFVLLFLSLILSPIFSQAQPKCGSDEVWDSEIKKCTLKEVVIFSKTKKQKCEEAAGLWNSVTKTCENKSVVTAKSCSQNSKEELHCKVGGGTNCAETLKEAHCVCKHPENLNGPISEYVRDTGVDNCPTEAPAETVAARTTSDDSVESCIQNIQAEINACKTVASKTIQTCDKNSAENAKITEPINSVINKATVALHTNAASKGALEQCRNVSLMSAAAGYGAGALQKGCTEEIAKCKQTCTDEILAYADSDQIILACQKQGGNVVDPTFRLRIEAQAEELSKTVVAAKNECGGDNTLADKMLDQAKVALAEMTRANQSAYQCEQALATNTPAVPLTNHCALNPNTPGCPVNCAYDTGNAQCKCLNNPSDPSCKGSGANLAAMSGGPKYQAIGGGVSSGFKPGAGSGGGGSGLGGDLDLEEPSEKPAIEQPKDSQSSESMFGAAAVANAGGDGGSGGGSPTSGSSTATEVPVEKSFLGGAFSSLKNVANSIFGGSSAPAKKTNASKDDSLNRNGFKPINPALRGLASNGKDCYVDAKGAEYCFGRRNMDIFKMMNSQYSNQYNTLITEK